MLSPRKHNPNSSTIRHISPSGKNSPSRNTIRSFSPTKENIPLVSLSSYRDLSPQALIQLLQQMKLIIIKLGGSVPQYSSSSTSPFLKLTTCQQASSSIIPISSSTTASQSNQQQVQLLKQQIKDLTIKLSNTEFELKKVIEDQAEGILKLKMEKDRDAKKYKGQIYKLEAKVKEDNQNWSSKCEELRNMYQQNLKNKIKQITQSHQQQIQTLKTTHANQLTSLKHTHTTTTNTLISTHTSHIQTLTSTHKSELQTLNSSHTQQIKQLSQKHREQIKQLIKKHDKIIDNYLKDIKEEKCKREEEIIKNGKIKEKLYNQLYGVRREKEELGKRIVEMKADIGRLEQEGKVKEYEWSKKQQQYKQEKDRQNLTHIHNLQKHTHTHTLNLQSLQKSHLQSLQTLQTNLNCLQSRKQQLQQHYKQQIQKLYQLYQNRPSRVQDLNKIGQLEYQINIKGEQLKDVKGELKKERMERENNQRNYKRIFSACGVRDKGDKDKGDKDKDKERGYSTNINGPKEKDNGGRERIYRMANTIDMSFLLKVCNKNF